MYLFLGEVQTIYIHVVGKKGKWYTYVIRENLRLKKKALEKSPKSRARCTACSYTIEMTNK